MTESTEFGILKKEGLFHTTETVQKLYRKMQGKHGSVRLLLLSNRMALNMCREEGDSRSFFLKHIRNSLGEEEKVLADKISLSPFLSMLHL